MKLTICKKICKECPFTFKSVKGWLGEVHTVDEIIEDMNRDIPFSCHLQRKDNDEDNIGQLMNGEQNVCRGYVASASCSAKQFGQHPIYGKQMRELQKEITEEDRNLVMNKWTFKKYHE